MLDACDVAKDKDSRLQAADLGPGSGGGHYGLVLVYTIRDTV